MSGRPRVAKRSSAVRRQATGSIGAPERADSVAGPVGKRGRLAQELDRHVAAAVATVAEEDEVLAVAQGLEQAAQVAPADERSGHVLAARGPPRGGRRGARRSCRRRRRAAPAHDELQRRRDEVHAADVHGAEQHAPSVGARLVEELEVVDARPGGATSVRSASAEAHHVDEVLGVVAERAARGAPDARVVRRAGAWRATGSRAPGRCLSAGQVVGHVAGRGGRAAARAARQQR